MLLMVSLCSAFYVSKELQLVKEVYVYTNTFRKLNGLRSLSINDQLNAIAQQHSENMAAGKISFSHEGFNNRCKLIRIVDSTLFKFAENIAYGPTSGEEVVKRWEDSPGHRQNMLGEYTHIGIGVAKAKNGTIYYTQIFGG